MEIAFVNQEKEIISYNKKDVYQIAQECTRLLMQDEMENIHIDIYSPVSRAAGGEPNLIGLMTEILREKYGVQRFEKLNSENIHLTKDKTVQLIPYRIVHDTMISDLCYSLSLSKM